MNPLDKIRAEQQRIKRHGTAVERIRRKKIIKRKISDFFSSLFKLYFFILWYFWLICVMAVPVLLAAALLKYLIR